MDEDKIKELIGQLKSICSELSAAIGEESSEESYEEESEDTEIDSGSEEDAPKSKGSSKSDRLALIKARLKSI